MANNKSIIIGWLAEAAKKLKKKQNTDRSKNEMKQQKRNGERLEEIHEVSTKRILKNF